MNSGMTVDLLDHVFMGCFSSTNGPFLAERPIYYLLRLIINLSEYLPFLLVLKPLASMPSRETGCGLPCPDLPSPPPGVCPTISSSRPFLSISCHVQRSRPGRSSRNNQDV